MGSNSKRVLAISTVFLLAFVQVPVPEIARTHRVFPAIQSANAGEQSTETATPKTYTGPKRRIAIQPVEGNIDYTTGQKVADILKDSLASSGEFDVRSGASGGADHLIRANVTRTQQYQSGGAGALGGAAQGLQTGHWLGALLGAVIGGALTFKPAEINARIELVDAKTDKGINSITVSGQGSTPTSSTPADDRPASTAGTKLVQEPSLITTAMDVAIRDAMDKLVEWLKAQTPFTIQGPGSFIEFMSQESIFERSGGGTATASAKQYERARVLEIGGSWVKVALKGGEEGWVYKEGLRPSEPDETFPLTISLTAPLDGKEQFRAAIEVSGRVWANRPIRSVTVNDKRVEISQGKFVMDKYPLNLGTNSLIIKATDELGGTVTKNLKIVRSKDTSPPTLSLTSHKDNAIVTTATIDLLGEVKDNGGLAWVKVNGREAAITGETFRFSDFPLSLGENNVSITSEDEAGNQSQAITVTVIRKRDTTPPVINITSPRENLEVRTGGVSIAGSVTDDSGVVSVAINDQAAQLTDGRFNMERIPLRVGANSIIVKAKDKAGNEATQQVIVTRVLGGSSGQKALSLQEIEELLTSYVSSKRVADVIMPEQGINFEVTDQAKTRLKRAGADNDLIQALERLYSTR